MKNSTVYEKNSLELNERVWDQNYKAKKYQQTRKEGILNGRQDQYY
jgi:hypothetical protein